MKTDLGLQEDVAEELAFDPSVDAARIGVGAKDGVVTLTGMVSSYAEKVAAEKAAKRVSGVKGVALEIEVELPALHQRSDAEIVAAALNVLDWESTLPKDAITVTVENGWLTLEGHVNWQYFKANAERAVRNLAGVTGISNSINVIPRSFAAEDVSERIRETFERSAQIDANRVVIEAGANGTVKLYGSVHSWAEHEDAARAAYSVPGVANVENHTLVNA